jgi:adenosylmethionine-8-amino-7-oxononanoate aminotransferase
MDHWVSADEAHAHCKEMGGFLRPFAHNIYTMPPYVTTPEELSRITAGMLRLAELL